MLKKLIDLLLSKNVRVFSLSLVFHFTLFFSPSNKITLILTALLLASLYITIKKFSLSVFYVFLIVLPFAKGKGIDILILDKSYAKNALFDITYLFPFYFSTFYFLLFYYSYLKNKLFSKEIKLAIKKSTRNIFIIFLLFIALAILNAGTSPFYTPILLASLQLAILLAIFFMPFIISINSYKMDDFYLVICSSTLFQSAWVILQTINNGYLGKDIEVHLPGREYGIRSTESGDLLRLPGTFFESSILATFLLVHLALLLSAIISKKVKNKKIKQIMLITICMDIFATLLTGSRAIYAILLFFLYLVGKKLYFNSKIDIKTILKQNKRATFAIGMLILSAILFIFPYFVNRITSIDHVFTERGSGSYRVQLTQYALRIMEMKPYLGIGLDLSPYYLATLFTNEDYFIDPARPHNIFVQLLAETGVIGTGLFFLFVYMILRQPNKKERVFSEFHIASILFLVAAQFYPIFINHMEIVSYLFLYLGFATYENQKNEK